MSTIRVSSVTRISTAADGTQADSNSFGDSFSPDGMKVAFSNGASNLVAGDTNGTYDVFIKDLLSGAVARISVASDGTQMFDSYRSLFSPDGNAVAFVSEDAVGWQLGFLKDLRTGGLWQLTTRLSGNVTGMDFSPDGNSLLVMVTGNPAGTAAFLLINLVTGQVGNIDIVGANTVGFDANFSPDGLAIAYSRYPSGVYVMDLTTLQPPAPWDYGGATASAALIDPKGSDPIFSPVGRKIAFDSTSADLVPGDTNGVRDVFVKDLTTGAITRISTADDSTQANGNSFGPIFSPDGNLVAFGSTASNLVPGDTNGTSDIFVKDLTTGSITRISTTALGEEANGGSGGANFSPDGSKILYTSDASNLVPGDSNQHADVFIAALQSRDLPLGLAGDFNADGKSDIVWQNDQGKALIWLLNGAALLGTAVAANPGPSWHVLGSGDFDGNGTSDVVLQNDNGQAAIWLLNGTAISSGALVNANPGPSWHIKGTGDFDGNGKTDILLQNDNGQAAIWLVDGTQIVAGAVVANPGVAWQVKSAGDFDGNGKSDVVLQNDSGQIAVWLLDGTNIVAGAALANPGAAWHFKGSGDFDGNGKSDVLLQNDNGQVAVWLMDGTALVAGAIVANPGPSWHVVDAADFSGDGKSDILLLNTSGQVTTWLMDGTHVVQEQSIGNLDFT